MQVRAASNVGSNLDKRIVEGYVFIWGIANDRGEKMIKGCCSKSIQERGPESKSKQPIKFFRQHNQADVLSLMEVLEEDNIGLYFKTVPLDPVDSADRVLIQLRSGSLNNFSGGWDYVWDKVEWDDSDDTLVLKEIELFEISVVGLASDPNTYCIRSKEELAEHAVLLNEELHYFIKSLPRDKQLECRNLFARQKSLFAFEPSDEIRKTLEENKPVEKRAIDYKFLKQNFNKK